jgi:hypothetical protein
VETTVGNPSSPSVEEMYARSLKLFTPLSSSHKPSPAFLPSQILLTLVLSGMKVDNAEVGKRITEEWLAARRQGDDEEGYEKILEMYCCHVLPRLGLWDEAREFLEYEVELPADRR